MQVARIKVSNPTSGVVVVTPDADRPKSYLRFEAQGDAEGGDVIYVSRGDAMQTSFIKAVKKGVLVVDGVEDDEELLQLLEPSSVPYAPPTQKLTVLDVIFNEKNSYKAETVEVPVYLDALAKV
ncbi:hypothetical protein ACFQ6C_26070 [Streptomyces sp. NPDC056454]|uniref:hypothetical protein n=1 Tax=Streptomyces sp. NPDC056454 TaxID=3345823 RepID=UPI003691B1BA